MMKSLIEKHKEYTLSSLSIGLRLIKTNPTQAWNKIKLAVHYADDLSFYVTYYIAKQLIHQLDSDVIDAREALVVMELHSIGFVDRNRLDIQDIIDQEASTAYECSPNPNKSLARAHRKAIARFAKSYYMSPAAVQKGYERNSIIIDQSDNGRIITNRKLIRDLQKYIKTNFQKK